MVDQLRKPRRLDVVRALAAAAGAESRGQWAEAERLLARASALVRQERERVAMRRSLEETEVLEQAKAFGAE